MNTKNRTWLHLGAGSFHRAHQAWYLHRLLLAGEDAWSIAIGNIRNDSSTATLKKLAAQDCRYTLETVDPAGCREYETIASIKEALPWEGDLDALTAVGARPETGVISFTVTESGYYLDADYRPDRDNPDLRTDLAGANTTIYSAVAAILRRRRDAGGGPVALLSCDNIRHNGRRFRSGLKEFLELRQDDGLLAWTDANTLCPCCMVDRITPRPGPDVAERVFAATGWRDLTPVMGESFIQWVVEDSFPAGRPALEQAGAEMVMDVTPYEEAKIRILNASHILIAWAGTLVGKKYIHEGVLIPAIAGMTRDYVTEDVIPCLSPSPLDLAAYRDTVLDRFSNEHILDTNQRVAADGFSKIPAMVVPTLAECYARGAPPRAGAMLPALFFMFLRMRQSGRLPYEYQDGVMNPDRVNQILDAPDPLAAYAADPALFGTLAANTDFAALLRASVKKVEDWLPTVEF